MSLDLDKIIKEAQEAFDKETPETLSKWLLETRKKSLEGEVLAAYVFLRENNHRISDKTLDFMLDASLQKIKTITDA